MEIVVQFKKLYNVDVPFAINVQLEADVPLEIDVC